jgi:DNA processing protein
MEVLQLQQATHIDEMYFKTGLSSSAVAAALLMLEMQGIVACMPGKLYKMI